MYELWVVVCGPYEKDGGRPAAGDEDERAARGEKEKDDELDQEATVADGLRAAAG